MNDFVAVPPSAAIPVGNAAYTIEAWISPSVTGLNGIVGWGNFGFTNQVNAIRLDPAGGICNTWGDNDLYVPYAFTPNTWYHVAATFDGVDRKIYINGVLEGRNSPTGHNVPNSNNFRIGSTNLGEYFNGGIDEVRIWNTAVSAADLARRKNCELQGNESGLVAYYKFNHGNNAANNTGITTLSNFTGTAGINGTLFNFGLTAATSNWLANSLVVTGSFVPLAPSAAPQSFTCSTPVSGFTPVPGAANNWYSTATGGLPLPAATAVHASGTYYLTEVNTYGCESGRTPVNISIMGATAAPIVTPAVNYVTGTAATPLNASGTNLLWYSSALGGIGSTIAPVPATSTAGTASWWVSQSSAGGCESARARIDVHVAAAGCNIIQLAKGTGGHSLAIRSGNTLLGWGTNDFSQIGDGTNINKNTPVPVGAASNWASVSSGNYQTFAIKTDGTLWAWGSNTYGQLGNGNNTGQSSAIQTGIAANWAAVYGGSEHTLAIKNNGSLWAWGRNNYGQLGDGTNINKNNPVQIGTAADWAMVSSGFAHSAAIKTDGSLWVWGYNNYGQLGDGTNTNRNTPVQIGTATDWATVSCGGFHTLAIKTDGSLWSWGHNALGQLGDGLNTNRNTPLQAGTAMNWHRISGGQYHSIALKTDGSLWGFGDNYYGALGDGTNINKNTPVQIGTAANWASINTGRHHTLALKNDGSLWSWGYNGNGELGDGTNTNRNNPAQIIGGILMLATDREQQTASLTASSSYTFNSSCRLIATVNCIGAAPVSGTVSAKVWIENTQPAQFVRRHYEITPTTNASTATGRVTLYFTQAEFDAFNAVSTADLPYGPGDVFGKANLIIEQRSGTSNDDSGLPFTYTGNVTNINPDDNDIVWNSIQSRWEISFDVVGFGGFFVKTITGVLPVKWMRTNATLNNNKQAVVSWTVEELNVMQYEVEKSADGLNFTVIGRATSKGNGINHYLLAEPASLQGKAYYRIRQTGRDGIQSYSRIMMVNPAEKVSVSVYPNPAEDIVFISSSGSVGPRATLLNTNGKVLRQVTLFQNNAMIQVQNYPAGLYLLKFDNGTVIKIFKQ